MEGDISDKDNVQEVGEKLKCNVCDEPIKKHKCIHYGARSCYSCRAFFRRSCTKMSSDHRKTGNEALWDTPSQTYSCNTGGTCEITQETRKRCQKCRFEKCLKVGMSRKWVLTMEQKKIRFKKSKASDKKARSKEEKPNTLEPNKPSTSKLHGSPAEALPVKANQGQIKVSSEDEAITLEILEDILSHENSSPERSFEAIHEYFLKSIVEIILPQTSILAKMVDFHHGKHLLQKPDLDQMLLLKMEQLDRFSSLINLPLGSSSQADQSREHAILTALGLILARYFTASDSLTQLAELIGKEDLICQGFWLGPPLRPAHFTQFVFLEGAGYDVHCMYFNMCVMIRNRSRILRAESLSALIAYLLERKITPQGQPITILRSIEQSLVHILGGEGELQEIFSYSTKLAKIFMSHFFWSFGCQRALSAPDLPFTREESLWMISSMDLFERGFWSVPFGEDMVDQFLQFAKSFIIHPPFLMTAYVNFMEKCRQILLLHQDFQILPSHQQSQIWHKTRGRGSALFFIMNEVQHSGDQQLRLMTGELNLTRLKQSQPLLLDPSVSLRKLSMRNFMPPNTPSNIVLEYMSACERLQILARNLVVLKLMALILLTNGVPELCNINRHYWKLAERLNVRCRMDVLRMIHSGIADVEMVEFIAGSLMGP